jgi:hypothetical protein
MATPAEIWDAYQRLGSMAKAAAACGVARSTAQTHINRRLLEAGLSDGIRDALAVTGVAPEHARFGYRRIKHEDGSFNTVMWKMPEPPPESAAERIREALEGMEAAALIPAPADADSDLLRLVGIADLHLGLRASAAEAGEDYDRPRAMIRARAAVSALLQGPPANTLVLLFAGDTFHANDHSALTPKSKHVLDVDGSYFDALADGVQLAAECVEMGALTHARVEVVVLPGNHDPASSLALMFALAERYRDNPRVHVERSPALMWAMSFGACLLGAHHGHDVKPEDLVHSLAEHPDWSACRYRYLKTGHRHQYAARMIGSVEHESMACVTSKDAWAAGRAFVTRPAMRASVFHKRRGEVARATVNL